MAGAGLQLRVSASFVAYNPRVRPAEKSWRHYTDDHDALSGPRAAHEDVAIVGVTNEPMTPPLPFSVQLIEHDASLRCSFGGGDFRSVGHHHARRQHPSHQGQQPAIGDPLGNPVEPALMMDPVEGSYHTLHTTHLHDIARSVTILRERHPFEGRSPTTMPCSSATTVNRSITAGETAPCTDFIHQLHRGASCAPSF